MTTQLSLRDRQKGRATKTTIKSSFSTRDIDDCHRKTKLTLDFSFVSLIKPYLLRNVVFVFAQLCNKKNQLVFADKKVAKIAHKFRRQKGLTQNSMLKT